MGELEIHVDEFSNTHATFPEGAVHAEYLKSIRAAVNQDKVFADEILELISPVTAAILFFGGMKRFNNKFFDRMYRIVFIIAFGGCFYVCSANLLYREIPKFNFAIDFVTAYIHVPVVFGYFFWRKFLHTHHGIEQCQRLNHLDDRRLYEVCCKIRIISRVLFMGMLLMSALVNSAFALPASMGHFDSENLIHFKIWHAAVMWFFIPPVTSCLICVYGMLALYSFLHILDFESTVSELVETLPSHLGAFTTTKSRNRQSMKLGEFDAALGIVDEALSASQRRLDESCDAWSPLYFHLLVLSISQVTIVFGDFLTYFAEDYNMYYWYWALQDVFHLVTGVTLIILLMGLGAYVTRCVNKRKRLIINLGKECLPSSVHKASFTFVVNYTMSGFKLFSIVVDIQKCLMFMFALCLLIFNTTRAILVNWAG